MKVIDVYPKDVYVSLEIPLKEIKKLQSYIEKSMPFYNKVMEDYEEREFLEGIFLPQIKSVIKQTEQFNV